MQQSNRKVWVVDPVHSKIRFATKEDMDEFAKIIGQKITDRTKAIWHPFKSHWGEHIHRFVDENAHEE